MRVLGCSREALAGHLREIEALGVEVRQGRLTQPIDLLDRGQLPSSVDIVDECLSTNALMLDRALQGAPHGSVLAAEHQTAGRGRRGNAWLSAVGAGLAFSLLWRFERLGPALSGLSLATAVGAARALESLGVQGIAVKWPNDLLIGGRKLGGILIEMTGEAAVIGVGINARLPEALAAQLPGAADLSGYGPPPRTRLLCVLLEHLAAVLEEFTASGFGALRDEWHARHAWQDREVTLQIAERRIAEGRALGVDESGALLLDAPGGVQRFHSGDLSLRPA